MAIFAYGSRRIALIASRTQARLEWVCLSPAAVFDITDSRCTKCSSICDLLAGRSRHSDAACELKYRLAVRVPQLSWLNHPILRCVRRQQTNLELEEGGFLKPFS